MTTESAGDQAEWSKNFLQQNSAELLPVSLDEPHLCQPYSLLEFDLLLLDQMRNLWILCKAHLSLFHQVEQSCFTVLPQARDWVSLIHPVGQSTHKKSQLDEFFIMLLRTPTRREEILIHRYKKGARS
mmetsp:Transcript_28693/g.66664  ORF Transcript_28693/g.66664 Transcript_28693/m.66664 type:complete len:128 (-) Transcript_28693:52-435(-)